MDSRAKTLIGALALFAVIIVAVLIGQGGGDDESDEPATAERQDKPEVEIPEGDPPSELVIEDLEEGEGDEAQPGDQLTVDYVGVLFDGGDEFDASFEGPEPLPVRAWPGRRDSRLGRGSRGDEGRRQAPARDPA